MKKIYLSIIYLFLILEAMAQNALPDPNFGNNGVVRTDFPYGGISYFNEAKKVLAAPDGSSFVLLRFNGQAVITHLNVNGSIDLAYGNNGYSVPVVMDALDAALQNDGKIVVAGSSQTGTGNAIALVRYNSIGSLDTDFDADGKVQTSFIYNGTNSSALAQSVAIQSDGKIVAAGYSYTGTGYDFTLVRYNSNGSLDADFNGDGKVQTPFLFNGINSSAFAQSVAIQSDGKIMAAGYSNTGSGTSFTLVRYNSNGSLDTDFDIDGKVQTSFIYSGTNSYAGAQSVAIQSDGKIVAAGYSQTATGIDFTLVRYNSDGSFDTDFDADGKVQTSFIYSGTNSSAVSQSVAIQSDGKIMAAGYSYTGTGNAFTLVRYNSDGSLDADFDGDGKIQTPFIYNGTYSDAMARSVAIQSDDKIVAAGYSQTGTGIAFTLVRYNIDGSLNTSFDGDGKLTSFINTGNTYFISTNVQSDGKVVAAGYSYTGTGHGFSLVRYNSNGSLDASFDGDGKVLTSFLYNGINSSSGAQSVAIQSDGKIVAAGYSYTGTGSDFTLVRYNSNGSLDTDFSGDGKVQTSFIYNGTNSSAGAQSVTIQSDGKIVAAGYSYTGTGNAFTLVRYNSNGSLDTDFDGDGKVQTPFIYSGTNSTAEAQSVVIQSDGKIVAAGYSQTGSGNSFSLVRYNSDGSLDTDFDGDGKVQTPFLYDGINSSSIAQSVAIQSDGKIVVAGYSYTGTGNAISLVRYNSDGSLDTDFDGDGKVQTPFIYNGTNTDAVARSVSIQSDSKVVAAGYSFTGTETANTLVRYNSNGSLDAGFYSGGKSQTIIDNFSSYQGYTIKDNKVFIPGSSKYYGEVGAVAVVILDESLAIQLSCPDNKVVPTDPNLCTAIVNDIDAIFTPDGSTPAYSFTLTGATSQQGEGSASGKVFNKGVTTVTYTLANDNTKSCSFTVTVEDKEKPVVITQNITIQLDANATATITGAQVNNGSTDNCTSPADLQLELDKTSFNCSNLGLNTITLTVTDVNGNVETGTANVNVDAGLSLVIYYRDTDGDGYGDASQSFSSCTAITGYVSAAGDCNDNNAAIKPGVPEVCDGVDNNCNGQIDEGVKNTYYQDTDGDGFGNSSVSVQSCAALAGYVSINTDCNDNDNTVYPGATELCDGKDNDCDGTIDDGITFLTYYKDTDGDGYGDASQSVSSCSSVAGYVTTSGDCNDNNAAIKPGAVEVCDGIDNDCDGQIDEGVFNTYYPDTDGDGYGKSTGSVQACAAPTGFVSNSTDCIDNDNTIYPGATELCDGKDNNCDGAIDDGITFLTYYKDTDGDGYGDASQSQSSCSAVAGYVTTAGDCNDNNAAIKPGAVEVCDGIDNDCEGQIDEGVKNTYYQDTDADGFGNASVSVQACTVPAGYVSNSTDCNDNNAAVKPGAVEICNGIDDDCDGQIDEGVKNTYYQDSDGDGFGKASVSVLACTAPAGYVSNNTDCNDNNAAIKPGATEICGNGIDDDCDGLTDEGCTPVNLSKVYISNAYVTEGNSGTRNAVFTLWLSNKSATPVTVQYQTANISATAPADYVTKTGTVTFPANSLYQVVTVQVKGDLLNESNESFRVSLASPTNATLGNTSGTGYINDDDRHPAIKIDNASATENSQLASVKVYLTAVSGQVVKVKYETKDESAKAPADYSSTNGQLIFQPGETVKYINVVIKKDFLNERTEEFEVKLKDAENATLESSWGGRREADVSILNSGSSYHNSTIGLKETDLTDQSLNLQVKVLPNPSRNYFQLNITGNAQGTIRLRITDFLGRVMEDKKLEGMTRQIKVGENWINGTYILEVIQGEERKTIQLVKLR